MMGGRRQASVDVKKLQKVTRHCVVVWRHSLESIVFALSAVVNSVDNDRVVSQIL
jgi:hypothetical protein